MNLPMPGDGFGKEEQFREVLKACDDEVDEVPELVDQKGNKDSHYPDQHHYQSQVGQHNAEAALNVVPLEPVDCRVEHHCQQEGEDAPSDEGACLPEQVKPAQYHRRSQESDGNGARHLRRREANPYNAFVVGYGDAWFSRFRSCRFAMRRYRLCRFLLGRSLLAHAAASASVR